MGPSHPLPTRGAERQSFAKGTWGGTFHDDFQPRPGDVVVHEHWGSSGFANTDLDLRLRQFGISRVVLVGMAWFRKCHFQVTPEIDRGLRVKGFLVLGVTLI